MGSDHVKNKYKMTLREDPTNYEGWKNLGFKYLQLGNCFQAIRFFQIASDFLNKKNAEAWNNLAGLYFLSKNYKKALACQQTALKLDPTNAHGWFNLGITYYKLEAFTKAIKCGLRATRISPTYAEAWHNIGAAHTALGNLYEAQQCHMKALELEPQYELANRNLNLVSKLIKLGEGVHG